jgi:hypothetical protein
MMAFQRQLNLRNKDVIISNPQKKVVENKASTSGTNKNTYNTEVNTDLGKGKEVVNKTVVNKEHSKEKFPPQELPEKYVENKKDMVLAERIVRPFSFESEIAKIKMSLPFNEICRHDEYRNQLIKMLKLDGKSIFSDTVNVQDDSPTILFGPRVKPNDDDDDDPPFYVTFKVHDLNLHNSMFDSGASHNLMPKEIMDNLGLDITRQYKDIYSFDSRKVKCLGLIKDLVISLHQILEKGIVMYVVVVDVPAKFGMLLSRSWLAKLKGTMQMDFSYATIPVFVVQMRLYRESRLKYMISSKECPKNHPIYAVDIEMGSTIFYKSEYTDPKDHIVMVN